jgi:hypothetical protein
MINVEELRVFPSQLVEKFLQLMISQDDINLSKIPRELFPIMDLAEEKKLVSKRAGLKSVVRVPCVKRVFADYLQSAGK